jgi:hypothetical protein
MIEQVVEFLAGPDKALYFMLRRCTWPALVTGPDGERRWPDLRSACDDASVMADNCVLIDFGGIEAVTLRFLRATVGKVLEADGRQLVLAHLCDEVADEVDAFLGMCGVPCLEFAGVTPERRLRARLLGPLDAALRDTLRIVTSIGSATAQDVRNAVRGGAGTARHPPAGVTAFNNRLADLHRFGLVRRRKDGRRLVFSPVAAELVQ